MGLTVVVLGMHRSGTSCATGLLQRCGLHLGTNLIGSSASNLGGHFESTTAVEINDALLHAAGGHWDIAPARLVTTPDLREHMRTFVEQMNTSPVAGWKDPRTVLTFPLWKPLLNDYRLVACLRHPMGVARSLATRDQRPLESGLELWRVYNERLLEIVDREPRVSWFDFDEPRDSLESWLRAACRDFGLTYDPAAIENYNSVERHYDPEPLPAGRIGELYHELARRAHRGALRAVGYDDDLTATSVALDGSDEACCALAQTDEDPIGLLKQRIRELEVALKKHTIIAQGHERTLRSLCVEVERMRWPELMSLARRALRKPAAWWRQRSATYLGQQTGQHEEQHTIPLPSRAAADGQSAARLSDAA